jgi:hypothetical protein
MLRKNIAEPDENGCVRIKVVTTASCNGQAGIEMKVLSCCQCGTAVH